MSGTSYLEMLNRLDSKIATIEQELTRLKAFRKTFVREFGASEEPYLFSETPAISDLSDIKPLSRRDAVVKLLQERGPMVRREIKKMTGFTHGTLSYVLNHKNIFINRDGKWDLVAKDK